MTAAASHVSAAGVTSRCSQGTFPGHRHCVYAPSSLHFCLFPSVFATPFAGLLLRIANFLSGHFVAFHAIMNTTKCRKIPFWVWKMRENPSVTGPFLGSFQSFHTASCQQWTRCSPEPHLCSLWAVYMLSLNWVWLTWLADSDFNFWTHGEIERWCSLQSGAEEKVIGHCRSKTCKYLNNECSDDTLNVCWNVWRRFCYEFAAGFNGEITVSIWRCYGQVKSFWLTGSAAVTVISAERVAAETSTARTWSPLMTAFRGSLREHVTHAGHRCRWTQSATDGWLDVYLSIYLSIWVFNRKRKST